MQTLPIVKELPRSYLEAIGRVTTSWATLEHELRHTFYDTLGISPKHGRVAVALPRASEAIERIRDLLSIDSARIQTDLKKFQRQLESLKNARDLICHGVWVKTADGKFAIQDLTGSWPKTSTEPSVKRRIKPGGMAVEVDQLQDLVNAIRSAATSAVKLHAEVREVRLQSTPS